MIANQRHIGRELGVVDIGSNSVRLVIYEIFGAHFTPIYNEKILAGLGRDLKTTGCLSSDGKTLTLQALKRFSRIAKARGLPPLVFGATAALRVAEDAAQFIEQVFIETGLNISPISGDEEARLTALGLVSTHPRASGLAADLGGASLELIEINQDDVGAVVGERVSLPLGPFDLIGHDLTDLSDTQISKARKDIKKHLMANLALLERGQGDSLYLIGGAWRNLALLHQVYCEYPLRTLQSYTMAPEAASIHAKWAYGEGKDTILTWPGMRQRRAETLPYSGLLLDILLDVVKPKDVIISRSGLREGLVHDAIPEAQRQRDPLFDGCRAFAKGSLQTENFGGPLFRFVETIQDIIPEIFNSLDDARLLRAACLMAGVGKDLHPDYRAEAIFAAVLYAPVAGLRHHERVFLALCLYRSFTTSKRLPSPDVIKELLSSEQEKAAGIIGATIRLAFVASGQSSELLDAFSLSSDDEYLILSALPTHKDLVTDQVGFRLSKLANKVNREAKVITC